MRDIKFRAWDKELLEMSYDFTAKNWLLFCIESPFVELMRGIGRTDSERKDIYESDIISTYNSNEGDYNPGGYECIYVVEWDEKACGFKLRNKKGEYENLEDELCSDYVSVIGNIYENPELLGGE